VFWLKNDLLVLFIFTPQNLSLMRGQKVYNSIIKDGSISGTIRKGRNNSLISKRNECMIARYYYYGYLRNKGYEEILKLLMSEFYLSPATIAFQVQQQSESLVKLRQLSPTVYYFMNRWPHYKW
jgi:hypothetical protein